MSLLVVASVGIVFPSGAQPSPPFVLEGVIVASKPGASLTLIRLEGAQRGRTVGVGDVVAGFRLVEVSRDGALFALDGQVIRLGLSTGRAVESASGPSAPPEPADLEAPPRISERVADSVQLDDQQWQRRRFDRADVNRRLMKELPVILSDTGLTPRVRNGEMEGLRLTKIPDGTLLSEAGLLPGDVLMTLNETPVKGLNSLMGLLSGLQGADEIRLVVDRSGANVRLLYEMR